jgi:cytochrome c553
MPERFIASATAASDTPVLSRVLIFALAASLAASGSAAAQQKSGKAAAPKAAAPAAAPAATPAIAGDYAKRFADVCAACHGANGVSETTGTPTLAGQHSFYAITQLFLFREGRRDNEAMTAVAKTMKDADMRGFSEYIGTLPAVASPPASTPPDPARMAQGRELAQQHKCVFCHGNDLAGGQQVPRIAGQREEYLRSSLQGFKSGKRPGYTMAMTEAVSQIAPADLDTLAYFAARFATLGATGK